MLALYVGAGIFVATILALRFFVRVVDRRRIRHLARYRGWTSVSVARGQEDGWGFFRRGERSYRVDYFDELGVMHTQECKVGAGFTVLWRD